MSAVRRGPRQPPRPRDAAAQRGPAPPRPPAHATAATFAAAAAELTGDLALAQPATLTKPPPLAQPSTLDSAPALAAAPTLEPAPARERAARANGATVLVEPPPPAPARARRRPPAPPRDDAPARRARPRELTGLRLLLDQLDDLLRDPTVSLWLKAAIAKLAGGVRRAAAAVVDALRRVRLPRRLLLGLLALLLPLVLLALLTGGDDEPATPDAPPSQAAGASLPGVTMPALSSADTRPRPVRVALVLDRTYEPAQLRRELTALGAWLGEHHAAGTRVTIIDAASGRASGALRASELAAGQPLRARPSTPAAIRAALGRPQDRRLLVTLGSTAPALGSASTLSITPRHGAAASAPSRSGTRSRAAIDDRRPNALAATVAREIMSVSGQRERR